MQEIAVNTPFEASEICQIVSEELQTRMRGLSPLHGGKEYAAFSVDFQVKIRLRRSGETEGDAKETLAWGNVQKGIVEENPTPGVLSVACEEVSTFQSKDPNEERIARDMPLNVETGDGRGGRIRKKVKVRGGK